jgi:hypothetical protein
MKKNSMAIRLSALLLTALIAVSMLAGCNNNPSSAAEGSSVVQALGTGSKTLTFEVTGKDGASAGSYLIKTDADTVGAALTENALIEGDTSEYGLLVKSVLGIAADSDADGAYWAFYIDGEYAMTGVDSTPIEAGKTYSFVYTKE